MKSPVYRFSDVLRALRNESGLTVLQAGEATCYANYERWESGQTRVGADHLANIATAFDVGEDLWLLVYAWLVDRFTPMPGSQPLELTGVELRRHLDTLPKVEVDLGEDHAFALGALSPSRPRRGGAHGPLRTGVRGRGDVAGAVAPRASGHARLSDA